MRTFLCFILILALGAGAEAAYFQVRKEDGRWWLVAPDGTRFFSKGVASVTYSGDEIYGTQIKPFEAMNKAKYGSEQNWRAGTAALLRSLGFNSLGSWSDPLVSGADPGQPPLAYARIIDLGSEFVASKQNGQAWLKGVFPDVFDPDFATFVNQRARELAGPHLRDPALIGWFTDNELRWGPDWRGPDELLTLFLAQPSASPGRQAAVAMLRQRYGDIARFNSVWGVSFSTWDALAAAGAIKPPVVRKAVYLQNAEVERDANLADPKRAAFAADCDAFVALLAERYFAATAAAVKAADPNHLNLGCRFAYVPPEPVLAAAARYLDVISFNCYTTDPSPIIDRYAKTQKPLLIGEFSFRGDDAGVPNTKGAGPRVATQKIRAADFEAFATAAAKSPNMVGYHWFKLQDEPKEGRFDGENSNYGIVNIHGNLYQELTDAMKRVNAEAEELHAGKPVGAVVAH